jgi:tetratricopeptide (TPR) repeat protein
MFEDEMGYVEALNELQTAGCNSAEISYELGLWYFKNEKFHLAKEFFTRSIQARSSSDAYFARARANYAIESYEASINDYAQFLEITGDLTEHYRKLQQNSPILADDKSEVHVSDGQVSEALNNSGYAALYLGLFEDAESYFVQLQKLEGRSVMAELGLAQTYHYWGCSSCAQKAVEFANKILALPGARQMYWEILQPILDDNR